VCVRELTAIIYPDSDTDWLVAECPEIGTASQGHTEEEALANLQEATDIYLVAILNDVAYLEKLFAPHIKIIAHSSCPSRYAMQVRFLNLIL
jgi:predicted RNase H-like HicB family nuclease